MDDLYENLDNYNEENQTIAELQTENKELKHKIEEYSATLSQLQKEFDKVASEYKQLELNYSSLLKTAKAEIERKTQIIANLNLEKDRMVLKSYQNKNASVFNNSRKNDNCKVQQNYMKDKYEKTKEDEKLKHYDIRKSSPYSSTERKEKEEPSRDTSASPHIDLRSKLLNLAHKGQPIDPRIEKTSEVKENIVQHKIERDAFQARASIRNRRKSMPVLSDETKQVSDDDDIGRAASPNNFQQINTEHNFSAKQKYVDYKLHERPRSRMSETSSQEEKKAEYHDSLPDRHKLRFSRYDRDKDDNYRVRHKSSHRYKRQSPDMHRSRSKEYHDSFHRSEHDRHRAKRLESPPRDKLHRRQSRDVHRSFERNHPYEHERLPPQSHERYAIKRKNEHIYDDLENKKLRMEPHSRYSEGNRRMELENKGLKMESHSRHHESDRRMNDERNTIHNTYMADPLEIQFSSCESPDYVYPDASNQHVKEIKLTATTKLDDPRVSSKKYIFKKSDGQTVLKTANSQNVVIVPIKKIAWGITPVSIPEALVKLPPEPIESARDVCMEMENPANISIESGEIDDTNTQNVTENVNKVTVANIERKEPTVPVPAFDNSKDIGYKCLKNINIYKIPKHRKSMDDKQSTKHSKEINLLEKTIYDTDSKNSNVAIKNIDKITQQAKPAKGKKTLDTHKQDAFPMQSKNQLPTQSTSKIFYEQKYPTAKEVVECDLEMSDDNCEDNEKSEYVTKEPVLSTEVENKAKSCNTKTEKQPVLSTEIENRAKSCNTNTEKQPVLSTEIENRAKSCNTNTEKQPVLSTEIENKIKSCNTNTEKQPVLSTEVENEAKSCNTNTEKQPVLSTEVENEAKSCNTKTEKQSTEALAKLSLDPSTDKTCTGADDAKKSKTKKKSKHKENKDACKNDESAKVFEKPAKKKNKKEETRSIQIKTKFSELFDDSSSLIYPEDLGLAPLSAPTTQLPDKCVPFFEDALDAADLNVMKSTASIKDSIPSETSNVEMKPHTDVTNIETADQHPILPEDSLDKSDDKSNDGQTEMTDDVIKSIYQNLEPDVPEEQNNVIKTVIISTGIQPPVLLEEAKQVPPSKPEPVIKTVQDASLKALATSTPHKLLQPALVTPNIESKLYDSGCNSNNNSQTVSVENSELVDKSDSNTMDSQTNDANVPDVRIFIKRRRKNIKK